MLAAANAAGFICGSPSLPGPATMLSLSYSGPRLPTIGFSCLAVASVAPGNSSMSSPAKPKGLSGPCCCCWRWANSGIPSGEGVGSITIGNFLLENSISLICPTAANTLTLVIFTNTLDFSDSLSLSALAWSVNPR